MAYLDRLHSWLGMERSWFSHEWSFPFTALLSAQYQYLWGDMHEHIIIYTTSKTHFIRIWRKYLSSLTDSAKVKRKINFLCYEIYFYHYTNDSFLKSLKIPWLFALTSRFWDPAT
jgi:hypothetical protein